jgi:hypothetical protein
MSANRASTSCAGGCGCGGALRVGDRTHQAACSCSGGPCSEQAAKATASAGLVRHDDLSGGMRYDGSVLLPEARDWVGNHLSMQVVRGFDTFLPPSDVLMGPLLPDSDCTAACPPPTDLRVSVFCMSSSGNALEDRKAIEILRVAEEVRRAYVSNGWNLAALDCGERHIAGKCDGVTAEQVRNAQEIRGAGCWRSGNLLMGRKPVVGLTILRIRIDEGLLRDKAAAYSPCPVVGPSLCLTPLSRVAEPGGYIVVPNEEPDWQFHRTLAHEVFHAVLLANAREVFSEGVALTPLVGEREGRPGFHAASVVIRTTACAITFSCSYQERLTSSTLFVTMGRRQILDGIRAQAERGAFPRMIAATQGGASHFLAIYEQSARRRLVRDSVGVVAPAINQARERVIDVCVYHEGGQLGLFVVVEEWADNNLNSEVATGIVDIGAFVASLKGRVVESIRHYTIGGRDLFVVAHRRQLPGEAARYELAVGRSAFVMSAARNRAAGFHLHTHDAKLTEESEVYYAVFLRGAPLLY